MTRPLAIVVLMSSAAVTALGVVPQADAAYCDPLLNGTYSAVSDGTWAKTNDVYHDETTVTSTWTIATSCTAESPDCAGQVTSSQGWSAPIRCETAGLWYVRRHLEHWEPCSDGTTAAGDQLLYFSADLSGVPSLDAVSTFSGWDRTVGVSGGCGINHPLVIAMPFVLTRVS